MKVAIIDQTGNIGGGIRFTGALVTALAQLREVEVVFAAPPDLLLANGFSLAPTTKTRPLTTDKSLRRFFPAQRFWGMPGTWQLSDWLRKFLLGTYYRLDQQIHRVVRDCDVAYFAWPYFMDFPKLKTATVVTIHDLNWKQVQVFSEEENRLLDRQMPLWARSAQAVVTSTYAMQQQIADAFAVPAEKISVVHLPAPTLAIPLPVAAQSTWFKKRRIAPPFVLCVGGVWSHKNHETLIRGFAEFKHHTKTDHILVCAGPHTDEVFGHTAPATSWERVKHLHQIVGDAGLQPGTDVIGVGKITDQELATLYATTAGLISPVLAEAGSFPILEAAAQGKPILCSDIAVYREQAEVYGLQPYYFSPLDAASLAQALKVFAQTSPAPESLILTAQKIQSRTWADVAQAYLKVFKKVI